VGARDSAVNTSFMVAYVYDAAEGRTDVVILEAQDFSGDPVATVRLPVRVPFGFHGSWAPDLDTASWGSE
jgi:carotenoid cleavage oxygenase